MGLKLNESMTKTLIIFRSETMHSESPSLTTIGGTVLKESNDPDIFRVTFDSKMTLEKHLRSVSEQLLKNLVSLRSPGEYSKMDCFLGNSRSSLAQDFAERQDFYSPLNISVERSCDTIRC